MAPRHKKLILVIGFLPFLLLYTGLILWIWDQIPDQWLLQFIFFFAAGTLWAFPMKPLMAWANRPSEQG